MLRQIKRRDCDRAIGRFDLSKRFSQSLVSFVSRVAHLSQPSRIRRNDKRQSNRIGRDLINERWGGRTVPIQSGYVLSSIESDLIYEARCRIGKLCGCRGGQVIKLVAVCPGRCRKVSEGGSPNSAR